MIKQSYLGFFFVEGVFFEYGGVERLINVEPQMDMQYIT
jgi:hypothetical protein